MPSPSILVYDNFYENPDEIRSLALAQQYESKQGALYPGLEAVVPGYDWSPSWTLMRSKIEEDCDAPCPKNPPFPQGKFRIALESDEKSRPDRAHVDVQRWSGIVYLSLPVYCRSGLVLYRNAQTGSMEYEPEWFSEQLDKMGVSTQGDIKPAIRKIFKDPKLFEEAGTIPMAYNRAILLMAHVYHGTGLAFGSDLESGRLTQHFEFYS